jgi:hypothetical protein
MKIGIDLDDTLGQSTSAVIAFHNDTYSTDFKMENLTDYIWQAILDHSKTQEESRKRVRKFHETSYGKNIKPVKDTKKVLERLKKEHELHIITARGDYIKKETEEWVRNNFPNTFSHIHFTNQHSQNIQGTTKKKICDTLGIDIFIEDDVNNASECLAPNRKVYLLNYPWNQTDALPEGIKRVYSWKEIGENLV